ncbi:MAG: molybdenum cofactor guanylyltransferase [Syntrophomonadaceae bacterium]|jgi:molybdopterin-guanine dinucleotide biosynthesis protein A
MAGGKSTRMKFNKAFARIAGKACIEIIIDKFKTYFKETIIISNEPELFINYNLPIYKDIYPNRGPVGGIHSALVNASYDKIFILGCDVPFMDMNLVNYMLTRLQGHDSVIPEVNFFLQPLAAAYSRSCLPVFSDCVNNGKLKLTRIFCELDTLVIKENELNKYGAVRDLFFNVNDPQALKQAEDIAGRLL